MVGLNPFSKRCLKEPILFEKPISVITALITLSGYPEDSFRFKKKMEDPSKSLDLSIITALNFQPHHG